MSSLFRRISAREEGFTLIELGIVTGLLMIVLVSILSVFSVVERASVRESARSQESDQVRLAMERLSKEIRQADDVRAGSGATFLDIDSYVNGTATHIVYNTAGNTLTRTANGSTTKLLERLSSTSIFSYDPDVTNPSVVTVTLGAKPEFYNTDATVVTLTSEIQIRNGGSQ
jgi:type II secretory pathway pseudopilin PulG